MDFNYFGVYCTEPNQLIAFETRVCTIRLSANKQHVITVRSPCKFHDLKISRIYRCVQGVTKSSYLVLSDGYMRCSYRIYTTSNTRTTPSIPRVIEYSAQHCVARSERRKKGEKGKQNSLHIPVRIRLSGRSQPIGIISCVWHNRR